MTGKDLAVRCSFFFHQFKTTPINARDSLIAIQKDNKKVYEYFRVYFTRLQRHSKTKNELKTNNNFCGFAKEGLVIFFVYCVSKNKGVNEWLRVFIFCISRPAVFLPNAHIRDWLNCIKLLTELILNVDRSATRGDPNPIQQKSGTEQWQREINTSKFISKFYASHFYRKLVW